ncbi:MAG: RNA ligase family protein [Atribacterota bacterium]
MKKYEHMLDFDKYKNDLCILTEKIDGANFRLMFSPDEPPKFGSKSHVLNLNNNNFYNISSVLETLPLDKMQEFANKETIIFYGELFGKGINKNIDYSRLLGNKERDVFFFDIYNVNEGFYYSRKAFYEICQEIGINTTPIITEITLEDLFLNWRNLDEQLKNYIDYEIEGIVIRKYSDPEFKVKHKTSKYIEVKSTKKPKPTRNIDQSELQELIDKFLTPERVKHAITRWKENTGIYPSKENTGDVIRDVLQDIKQDYPEEGEKLKRQGKYIAKLYFNALHELQNTDI